jgi:hypothetical protein
MNEVEYDMKNYQARSLCYHAKPKAESRLTFSFRNLFFFLHLMKMQAPKTNTTGIHTARTISNVSLLFLSVVSSWEVAAENSPETCNKYNEQ